MPGRGPTMWRMASCCDDDVRPVDICGEGLPIGLSGLQRIFAQLYALGL